MMEITQIQSTKSEKSERFPLSTKKIKKRRIEHKALLEGVSDSKNCPKYILSSCWANQEEEILKECQEEGKELVQSCIQTVRSLSQMAHRTIKSKRNRDSLNLHDLKETFSYNEEKDPEEKCKKSFFSSQAFFRYLRRDILKLIADNRKIQKPLSYFILLQKFTSRLCNPALLTHLQFK